MLPPARDTAASARLDAARGVSSLLVLAGHLRAMFLLDAKDVPHMSRPLELMYGVSGLGHEAVVVFFVLSGFFISAAVIRPMQQDRWQPRKYAADRLSRIYTVLVPALVVGAAFDILGPHFYPNAAVYSAPHYGGSVFILTPGSLSLQTFIGNLALLQTIIVPCLGSNGPLWSLANEGWYYVAFPLLAISTLRSTPPLARLLAILAVCGIVFMTRDYRHLVVVWLLGPLLVIAPRSRLLDTRTVSVASYVVLFGMLAFSRTHTSSVPTRYLDISLGVAFAFWVQTQGFGASASSPSFGPRFSEWLAKVSYTLYLAHFPLLAFLCAAIIGENARWTPSAEHLVACAGIGVLALLWASLQWAIFERNTPVVRGWLKHIFERKPSAGNSAAGR